MKAITKYKIFGINLIGLIIGSALGVFVLSVIVRVSYSISNTYQIIKANSDLALSARILNNFFSQVFSVAGYLSATDGTTNSGTVIQYPGIFNAAGNGNTSVDFTFSYSAGVSGALLCSGQPYTSSGQMYMNIILSNGTTSAPSITNYNNALPTGVQRMAVCYDSISNPPVVSPQQFIDFSLATTLVNNSGNMINLKIAPNTTPPVQISGFAPVGNFNNGYSNQGVKLAILLRSEKPVFNIARSVTFNGFNGEVFSANDKYLYKLVVIQSPFFYGSSSNPIPIRFWATS
ncbi:MAG: hypothetical protein ABSA84_03550 [Gammaproteobacteria bacterium]|jgi:hypothetical protein